MPLPFLLNGIMESQKSGHLYTPKGSYDSIASITVPSGGLSSITFQGIPAGYRHLQIRISSNITYSAYYATLGMTVNGDTGNNYSYHDIYGLGSSLGAQNATSQNRMYIGWAAGTTSGTSAFGALVLDVLDYASTTKNKTVRSITGIDGNGGGIVSLESNAWLNTNPITSINIFPHNGSSFNQYSSFALYGCK